jgi:hypothetical protein
MRQPVDEEAHQIDKTLTRHARYASLALIGEVRTPPKIQ